MSLHFSDFVSGNLCCSMMLSLARCPTFHFCSWFCCCWFSLWVIPGHPFTFSSCCRAFSRLLYGNFLHVTKASGKCILIFLRQERLRLGRKLPCNGWSAPGTSPWLASLGQPGRGNPRALAEPKGNMPLLERGHYDMSAWGSFLVAAHICCFSSGREFTSPLHTRSPSKVFPRVVLCP